MLNVLVTIKENAEGMNRLKKLLGVNVTYFEVGEDEECSLPAELISHQHILFCEIPPTNFEDMKSVQFIQIASAGYSQLYGLDLVKKNIQASNALGLNDIAIAEWNICMMIALKRNLRGMIKNQEHGVWDRSGCFQQELRGSVVGFWGYGGIARQTARLAKAMGLVVHAIDKYGVNPRPLAWLPSDDIGDIEGKLPDRIFAWEQKKEFLRGLDFLVMGTPLTQDTKGMVGEEELATLPASAYILNPARGPLIQEEALINALANGIIAGAALDTHYYYPMPSDHPLWHFPNVIMTPHISGAASNVKYFERVWDIFVSNVERLIDGQPLLNKLTENQLNGF